MAFSAVTRIHKTAMLNSRKLTCVIRVCNWISILANIAYSEKIHTFQTIILTAFFACMLSTWTVHIVTIIALKTWCLLYAYWAIINTTIRRNYSCCEQLFSNTTIWIVIFRDVSIPVYSPSCWPLILYDPFCLSIPNQ